MAKRDWENLLDIGDRLMNAQAREQEAAETYRYAPDKFSREIWLEAVHAVEAITTEYLEASRACVEV
jgi:hypothetical protein